MDIHNISLDLFHIYNISLNLFHFKLTLFSKCQTSKNQEKKLTETPFQIKHASMDYCQIAQCITVKHPGC